MPPGSATLWQLSLMGHGRNMALATLASSEPGRPDQAAVEAVLAALAAQFGPRLVTSLAVRQQRAHTTTWLQNQPADAVVLPRTAPEVQAIVRLCAQSGVPVVPYGTGTSLEGHIN